ncbi:MAG: glutaminase [Epsilonproteobacteria bacterium]|nr:glutaminase [Campylobacterota bacterium]
MDYKQILEKIYKEIKPELKKGEVASYIPALAKEKKEQFAMSITLADGSNYSVGDSEKRFSIQSISKVFTFAQALNLYQDNIFKRVGVEPSGNPFNSLVQLEYENGKPRNPFINAGALVITDMLVSYYKDEYKTLEVILNFVREISSNKEITFDPIIAKSEMEHGFRNLALANLMKSFNNFENDVKNVVFTYFKHCAIMMNTKELSRAMLFLAFGGEDPITNKRFLTKLQAKRVNAVMLTCGHYDASGEFAYHVGLPGKSGVGGGIVAVVPNKLSIAVFSPGLNEFGNSHAGTIALEKFTTYTGLSIF